MEINKKRAQDWGLDNIENFWNWESQNPESQGEYFTSMMGNAIVHMLRSRNLLKGKVLDYGCGAGHLLSMLVQEPQGAYYGLDFSPDSIEATRKKCSNSSRLKELLWIKGLPSSFPANEFDTITFIETIEHLQDEMLHATLDELYRILKPGGKIFMTTPFNEDLARHLTFCPFCRAEFHHMQHMQSFTVESMTALVKKHGFVVEYCKNIDLYKYQMGSIKYAVKKMLIKMAVKLGLKQPYANSTPNLVVVISKI